MHVVVVGGGFGGVKAALELSKRQIGKITLISDQSYFLHHATLYATATGRSTEESVIPLNVIFENHPNVTIVEDTITSFDPHRKLISSKKKDYHYDELVLALGAVTSYFGIKGMEKHSYGIKTLQEVEEFHEHIHEEIIQKKLDREFFVIGAGPTGVELASALMHYLKTIKRLYRISHFTPKVTLVEMKDKVLPHWSNTASSLTESQLRKQGIALLLNHKVTALEDNKVTIDGKLYSSSTVVWTSGMTNHPFFKQNAGYFDVAKNGLINVNPYLEAIEHVYVIGDSANIAYTGRALPANKQAVHVAKNIARVATGQPQAQFRPHAGPVSVPVGEHWGYVEWFGLYIAGRPGKALRRYMELRGYCRILPLSKAVPIWRSHDLYEIDKNI